MTGREIDFIVFDECESFTLPPSAKYFVETLLRPDEVEALRQRAIRTLIVMLHMVGRGRVAQICNLINQHRELKELTHYDECGIFDSW